MFVQYEKKCCISTLLQLLTVNQYYLLRQEMIPLTGVWIKTFVYWQDIFAGRKHYYIHISLFNNSFWCGFFLNRWADAEVDWNGTEPLL